jgi:thiol-disulfide isomerase/thioredoxin
MKSKKGLWIGIVVVIILLAMGVFIFSGDSDLGESGNINDIRNSQDSQVKSTVSSDGDKSGNGGGWIDAEFKDVRTGESFRISDFAGKPVLLESFAVWCPTCTKQQKEIKEFHEDVGDSVVSISLDTDPNEDEARVLEHVNSNGFDWYYAVSPASVTQELINEFGVGFVNAPSVPMALICDDGSFEKLGGGVKDVDELKEAVANCGD